MADRIFPQINTSVNDLVHLMTRQIERIESTVSSTDQNIQLMAVKLDNLISLLERKQFLENPATWTGSPAGEGNWAHKGMFTAVDFPHTAMLAKENPLKVAVHANSPLDSKPGRSGIKKNRQIQTKKT